MFDFYCSHIIILSYLLRSSGKNSIFHYFQEMRHCIPNTVPCNILQAVFLSTSLFSSLASEFPQKPHHLFFRTNGSIYQSPSCSPPSQTRIPILRIRLLSCGCSCRSLSYHSPIQVTLAYPLSAGSIV